MTFLYVPDDNMEQRIKWEDEGAGSCGPSCMSIIEHKSIKEVLEDWKTINGEYKTWATWKEMQKYLAAKKYDFEVKRIVNGKVIVRKGYYTICRVQWLGPGNNKEKPFYGYGHWAKATANTHFIIAEDEEYFWCNANGWLLTSGFDQYLVGGEIKGLITSYIQIKKKMRDCDV